MVKLGLKVHLFFHRSSMKNYSLFGSLQSEASFKLFGVLGLRLNFEMFKKVRDMKRLMRMGSKLMWREVEDQLTTSDSNKKACSFVWVCYLETENC